MLSSRLARFVSTGQVKSFVQLWLDTIKVGAGARPQGAGALGVNKDVQDAILADPQRRDVVDIINIEQGFTTPRDQMPRPVA